MRLCDSVNLVEVYGGRSIDVMPKLLAEGRVPIYVSQLMNYRLNGSGVFLDWKNFSFNVSDLIAYSSESGGRAKFILTVNKEGKITDNGRKALELINTHSKLFLAAVDLENKYDSLDGIGVEIERDLIRSIPSLTHKEILENKVWRILARHPDEVPSEFAEDKNLLKEYSSWVANQTYQDKNMGVWIDSLSKVSKLGLWHFFGLPGSGVSGICALGNCDGRIIGFLSPKK